MTEAHLHGMYGQQCPWHTWHAVRPALCW